MKLSNTILPYFALLLSVPSSYSSEEEHEHCTHGKLFVSDAKNGTTIHVIELNSGNFTKETVHVQGGPGANDLYVSENRQVVAVLYYGSEDTNYTDGSVNWIHSGASLADDKTVTYDTPTVLPNAAFECILPLHFSANGDMISIFCDGSYDPLSNSTIWVIDESKLTAETIDENAILYNTSISSSHHGNSVPFDNGNNLFYSLPTPDRISRNSNGTADELADTFQVADMEGNEIYTIADTSNADTSCGEHHGIANTHDTVMLACGEVHGGVLMVSYDESSKTYSSRSLAYPVEGYRSFHFEQHPTNPSRIVGDLLLYDPAANVPLSSFHLFSFSADDVQLTDSNAVKLPTEQYPCGFSYEKSQGKLILALLAEGLLLAYEFESSWKEVARLQVVENMTKCSQAVFVSGYAQAFVLTNTTLNVIDISKAETEGTMSISYTTPIDFTPYFGVVAGVPPSTACTLNITSEEEDDDDNVTSSNSTKGSTSSAARDNSWLAMVMGIIMSMMMVTAMVA